MVYDEGFNIDFEDYSFFAFSKYLIDGVSFNKKITKSQCYSTCVGWYTNKDNTQWGCYTASKAGADPYKVTFENKDLTNLNIVQPGADLNQIIMPQDFLNYQQHSSFLSAQDSIASGVKLNNKFKNHENYVTKLNKIKKSWTAGIHPNFADKTIEELNKMAGRIRFKSVTNNKNKKSKQFFMNNSQPLNNLGRVLQVRKIVAPSDLSHLPKELDMKYLLRPAGSQGSCGSCYVFSTLRMLEARLKLLYNHDVNLSVQHSINCSIYNQGCNGGYPFLVMKFAKQFGLVPEKCVPYTERDGTCNNSCDISELPYLYRATDYKYLGGSYGKCTEKLMMEELLKNGPFVVSFEPDYNFMMYKSGIYHSLDLGSWLNQGLPKPEWEKVDHSVLLVGWGEDKLTGEKFWTLQNTWGPEWGEEGFFRIRRGVDEFAVESICETAVPLIFDNKNNQPILPKSGTTLKPSNGNNVEIKDNISDIFPDMNNQLISGPLW